MKLISELFLKNVLKYMYFTISELTAPFTLKLEHADMGIDVLEFIISLLSAR